MKSDCEDSTTLEEKGAEVFVDYSYGDIVKSRIQWFEQLKNQTFAPKPVTDVWSCWTVPNQISGAYGQKIQLESPPSSNNNSGREEISPPKDDISVLLKAPIQDGFTTGCKSVQFEVNVGQDLEVQQERRPTDLGLCSRPDPDSVSRAALKLGNGLEIQQDRRPADLDSIAGCALELGPGLEIQQERRPVDPNTPGIKLGPGMKSDPCSISGPSLKSGPGLLKSPMLVSQANKASGPDMAVKEEKEFQKGQS